MELGLKKIMFLFVLGLGLGFALKKNNIFVWIRTRIVIETKKIIFFGLGLGLKYGLKK